MLLKSWKVGLAKAGDDLDSSSGPATSFQGRKLISLGLIFLINKKGDLDQTSGSQSGSTRITWSAFKIKISPPPGLWIREAENRGPTIFIFKSPRGVHGCVQPSMMDRENDRWTDM